MPGVSGKGGVRGGFSFLPFFLFRRSPSSAPSGGTFSSSQSPLCFGLPLVALPPLPCSSSPQQTRFAGLCRGPEWGKVLVRSVFVKFPKPSPLGKVDCPKGKTDEDSLWGRWHGIAVTEEERARRMREIGRMLEHKNIPGTCVPGIGIFAYLLM